MSARLIAALETAFGRLAQEHHQDASVLVQLAAGDYATIKSAVDEAKAGAGVDITAVVAERDALKAENADLTTEMAAAETELAAANAAGKALSDQLGTAQSTITSLNAQVADLNAKLAAATKPLT